MKKLLSSLMLLAFMATLGFAQVPAKATSSQTTTKMSSKEVATKQTVGMKKDGTPDKRFKANQAAKPAPVGPTKKDGSLDMRYKANKTKPTKM